MSSVVDKLFSVEGKTALITGASSGIGRDVARFLAEAGANVVVTARRKDRLDSLVEEITALGKGKAVAIVLDVGGDEPAIDAAVAEAWAAFGRIDILFNNAGVFAGGGSANDHTVESYETVFNVNFRGLWLVSKAVTSRQVADGKGGSVINTSSVAANITFSGASLYASAKAAVSMLTQHMAKELGHSGIRVNAICPGVIDTDMAAGIVSNAKVLENIQKAPIPRFGKTKDILGSVLLLASDAGAYITGSEITMDGGMTLTSLELFH